MENIKETFYGTLQCNEESQMLSACTSGANNDKIKREKFFRVLALNDFLLSIMYNSRKAATIDDKLPDRVSR